MDLTHADAIDPVCGMRVARDAPLHLEFRGVTYRFCDPACAATFRDDPERWRADAGDQPFEHVHAQ